MTKDKKKKKDKKAAKAGSAAATLKSLSQNPLVADVVAAALVATAAALKDSNRARALASDAGEELSKLSKAGAGHGEAMWDLALQIGRRSLESLISGDGGPKAAKPKAAKPKTGKAAAKKTTKKQPSAARKG